MQPSLGNRLAVYAIKDLALHTPQSIIGIECWQDQCGFWLAQIAATATDFEQEPAIIGYLKDALAKSQVMPQFCIAELQDTLTSIAMTYLKEGPPCRSN